MLTSQVVTKLNHKAIIIHSNQTLKIISFHQIFSQFVQKYMYKNIKNIFKAHKKYSLKIFISFQKL